MTSPTFHVSVAAHYVPGRVPFLADVLRAILDWDRRHVEVTLVTNDLALAEEPLLVDLGKRFEERGFALQYDKTHGMAHPWHLTWWHKAALREWLDAGGTEDDLYMYIEDDIVVDADNVAYFTKWLPALKAKGCLPGFLRFEKGQKGEAISPDYRGYQEVLDSHRMTVDGQEFIAPSFPYWAGFIMDRELAAEYFASPWSDLEIADTMPQSKKNSCRVQSAWALTHENVPAGLPSRYVVPVDKEMNPLTCCMVWHSANNYSVSKTYSFGTVPMRSIFQRPGPLAKGKQALWNAAAFRRRVVDKVRRSVSGLGRG